MGDVTTAERWLRRAVQAGAATTSSSDENGHSLTERVLEAALKAGDAERAEHWMESLARAQTPPGAKSFAALVDLRLKQGETERAKGTMALAVKLSQMAEWRSDAAAISSLLRQAAQIGDVAHAECWRKAFGAAGGKQATIYHANLLLGTCAKGGDVRTAERAFKALEEASLKPNAVSFGHRISAYAKAGDASSAEAWLGQLLAQCDDARKSVSPPGGGRRRGSCAGARRGSAVACRRGEGSRSGRHHRLGRRPGAPGWPAPGAAAAHARTRRGTGPAFPQLEH